MLAIDALEFHYPSSGARFRFDLEVPAGEVVGLVGPSGSGKSTLLDLIAGFLSVGHGDVRLAGTSILPLGPEDRPVSILFQSDNVFDHLSAGANVALGLGPRARHDPPAVSRALAEMGLHDLGPRKAAMLSGGQKQRVALARTLLRNRPVLLLDEPFSGLDEQTAGPIRTLIGNLVADNGWHGILVSHQREDIAALTHRHYVIEDGRTRKG